jgi:hypothetical protein
VPARQGRREATLTGGVSWRFQRPAKHQLRYFIRFGGSSVAHNRAGTHTPIWKDPRRDVAKEPGGLPPGKSAASSCLQRESA